MIVHQDSEVERAESPYPDRRKPAPLAVVISLALVLAAVYFLAWASAIGRPFVDDDWGYLKVVQQPGWWHSSTVWSPSNGLYRPVLYLWFGGLHAIAGLHPVVYHLATALVALVIGLLMWRIGLVLGMHRGGALVAGIVVLFSPVVGYSVSWTAAASSPIAVAFALGAMLVLLNRPPTVPRAVVAALLLLLGLLTREVVIVAPAVLVALTWAIGGRLRSALRPSVPLWIAAALYALVRAASGARDPTGPYHLGFTSKVLVNAAELVARTGDLPVASIQARDLVDLVLWILIAAMLYWALLQRSRIVVAGLIWFGLGLLPVALLVNHAPEAYYIDFALPGLAVAIGGGFEQLVSSWPDKVALVLGLVLVLAIGFAGRTYSETQYNREMGSDIALTRQLLAEVERTHPMGLSGAKQITVRSTHVVRVERIVSSRGDLFRVVFNDPSLRVHVIPWHDATDF